jgi:hypothetical protein
MSYMADCNSEINWNNYHKPNMKYVVLTALLAVATAHICLIHPHQRGEMDISEAGSHTCLKQRSPCGGAVPDEHVTPFKAGPNQILLQQNLNHYTIGNSGRIDIALSYLENPSKDEDFHVLDQISDYYAYRQWTRTNYSLTVNMPDIDCKHCVLRVRYLPNKPTEPTFHQCSDISITKTQLDNNRPSNKLGNIYALRYNKLTDDAATLVEIDPNSNTLTSLGALDGLIVRGAYHPNTVLKSTAQINLVHNRRILANFKPNIANQIVTADPAKNIIFYVMSQGTEQIPNHLIYFKAGKSPIYSIVEIKNLSEGQVITALNWDEKKQQLLALTFKPSGDEGAFQFQVNQLDIQTGTLTVLASLEPDDTFVDFLTTNFDPVNRILYILIRDENSDIMGQKLFAANIETGKVSIAPLNTKQYVYSDFVFSQQHKALLTVSPGPVNVTGTSLDLNYFDLIKVNVTSGVQEAIYRMDDTKKYSYYGGNVWNGYDQTNGAFFHVFRLGETSELRVLSGTSKQYKTVVQWKYADADLYNVIYIPQ